MPVDPRGPVIITPEPPNAECRAAERRAPNLAGVILLVAGAAAVAWSTLRPSFPLRSVLGAGCCSATDLVLNILLFIPFGAGLALLGLRARTVVAVGALCSGGIELSQLWFVVGRDPSIHDIITNTVGTWLGARVVLRWAARAQWWLVLGRVIAVAVVSWWIVVAFAVRPAIPGPSGWFAQWAHEFEGTVRFGGEVLSLTLQGQTMPDGPVQSAPALRAELMMADTIRLVATVAVGLPASGRAQVAGVVAGQPARDYMSVWREGRDLIAYQGLDLSIAEHPGVWLRLNDALPGGEATVKIALTTTRDRVRLTAESDGRQRESSLRLAPELYWGALFFAGDRGIERIRWWSFVPGMISFLGLGLGLQRRISLLVAGGAALVFGPLLTGTALPSWPVMILALLAGLGGQALAKPLQLFGGGGPSSGPR